MLARTLGRTLLELGHSMTAAEFGEHQDEYARYPWGALRDDYRTALICWTIHSTSGKQMKSVPLDHFMRMLAPPPAPDDEPESKAEETPLEHFRKFIRH